MYNYSKKLTARLLLFSLLLESCYNPNIGMGKQALPTLADPAYKQGQYEGEPYSKYPPKPTSHTFTTADNHPIKFTYHNGQWQAEVEEYAAHGSWQRRQLPMFFEPGLALQDVVDSNPTEQKLLLHLCASEEDPDQPSYVYVGRAPIQAKPQLLSSPAARQTALQSEVGPIQQQATAQQQPRQPSNSAIHSKHQQAKQPQQAGTSTQQAQEQQRRQAVLALPSPVQQIGEGPKSQDQLPTTPARARSKALPATSRETPRQRVTQNQSTSAQRAPSRKALSWRNQHELLHSQRAAQAKREERAAMAKPANEPAQTTQPRQAIVATPTQPPSLADKAPQGIASQNFLAQGGQQVRFMHQDGQWQASVRERIGVFSRVMMLPVACGGHGDIESALLALQAKPSRHARSRIHVLPGQRHHPPMVYLGAQGLQGGGNGTGEASGSEEPQDDLAAVGQEGAQGREQSAPQGSSPALVTLQARMAQGDITSTSSLVDSFNAAQTPEEQQALQQWIQPYVSWFTQQPIETLTPAAIQEYTSLAHIEATLENSRELLKSYFNSLCNKIDREYQHGEEPLIEALEYTLQNIDSRMFEGDPVPLIQLGNKLLAKLDPTRTVFSKETYPTHRSKLYALHQALVLIKRIAPSQLNLNQEDGLYSRFKAQIQAISASTAYYPICYHALLLEQSLQRLQRPASSQARLQGGLRRVGYGLEGMIYLGQGVRALAELDFDLGAFKSGYESLKEAFTRQGIEAKAWYDRHQFMNYASLLSLKDPAQYQDFEACLQILKDKDATLRKEKDRTALHFGIVMQLRMLALHSSNDAVRKKSIQWLEDLAKPEVWGGDPALREGLLDGLAGIAVHSQGKEKAEAVSASGRLFCAIKSLLREEAPKEHDVRRQLTLKVNTLLPPPPAVSFFVGREQELDTLRQSFQTQQERIIAPPITGPGGIGKTQLALRVVKQQVEEGRYDHVFWIPAESAQKLLDAYLCIAEGLRIHIDKKDLQRAAQTVRTYLQDRHCLYVFDDAPDIAAIQDFLPLGQGHVLITSRNSHVGAWPTKPLLMNPFDEQEALALAQELGYGQSSQNQEAFQSLLKQVPCYPLTLVQLLSTLQAEGLEAAELLEAMQQYTATAQEQELITLLNERPHARIGYAQSMVYVLKTSLERLSKEQLHGEKALQLISQLAYLDPKGIPLDWLLAWDTEDASLLKRKTRAALSLLEKYSLIQWDKADKQVYLHAETQLMVRHLRPQELLTVLINRLVDYVGDRAEAPQNAGKWLSLLPHGRMLFERLDAARFPEAGYILTKYLADACSRGCLFKEGVSWAKKCLAIAQNRYPDQDHPDVARSFNSVGVSLGELGHHQEALQYKQEALAMRKRLYPDQDHPDVAYSLSDVGSSLSQLGKHQEALQYKQEALELRKRLFEDQDHPDVAHTLNSVGELLSHLGHHQESLQYKQEALAMRKRLFKDQDHPDVARSLTSVGISLEELGNYQESLQYKQEALAMRKRLFKDQDHPDVAHSLNNVGETFMKIGNPEEGLVYCQRALALRKRLYQDQNHPHVAYALNSIGIGFTELDKAEEGLAYSKQALAMLERVYPERDHPYMAPALNNIGVSFTKLGKPEEGLVYSKQALAMQKRLYQEQDHPWLALFLNNMGVSLTSLGRPEEGLSYCQQALAVRQRLYLDQDHPYMAQSLNSVGQGYVALGQYEKALTSYKDAVRIALRVYQRAHPQLTKYLYALIETLNKVGKQPLVQQAKDEIVPLCLEVLGKDHPLTQELLAVEGGNKQ